MRWRDGGFVWGQVVKAGGEGGGAGVYGDMDVGWGAGCGGGVDVV
jgi:hypothetical protein